MTTHAYYLPNEPHLREGWAIVFVDQRGVLSIVSDYGNWAYFWGSSGRVHPDFRRELLRFGDHYVCDKLAIGVQRVFDAEATVKSVRRRVVTLRRSRDLEKDFARRCFNEVSAIDGVIDFYEFIQEECGRWNLFWEYAVESVSGKFQLVAIRERLLPRLRAEMQAQLDTEGSGAA